MKYNVIRLDYVQGEYSSWWEPTVLGYADDPEAAHAMGNYFEKDAVPTGKQYMFLVVRNASSS